MKQCRFLSLPGFWLDDPDRDWASSVHHLLSVALDCFNEAIVALELFRPLTRANIEEHVQSWGSCENHRAARLRSIAAKSFVYSLDSTGQILKVIMELPRIPREVSQAFEPFRDRFRMLHRIRNSLQHMEARARWKGRHNELLDTNVLFLGVFNDQRFGATTEKGRLEQIEVSAATLIEFARLLQEIIWSFKWFGPGNQPVQRATTDGT